MKNRCGQNFRIVNSAYFTKGLSDTYWVIDIWRCIYIFSTLVPVLICRET